MSSTVSPAPPVRGARTAPRRPAALLLAGLALSTGPACLAQEAEGPLPGHEAAEPPADFPRLRLEPIADGLKQPLYAKSPPGQPHTLWVLEKAGRIRVVDTRAKSVVAEPLLDISDKVTTRSERGLLGLAFPTDFERTGVFYIHYSGPDGETVVSRMQMDADKPGRIDVDSEEVLLTQEQPYANHDGGELSFGPDGMLYLGLGDGGAANDPLNAGQDPSSLLGKILRFDVSGGPGTPYTIPEDNPFVGDERFRPEIWAWGLRNPWRFSFDRATGDLWIGDVGQNKWEEVNFQPAASGGGENYGWRIREAAHPFRDEEPPVDCELVEPFHEYAQGGPLNARSVTGGYVYRGSAIPALQGWYVFGDYVSGQVWALQEEAGERAGYLDLTPMLAGEAGKPAVPSLASFGEDRAGELYLISLAGGTVHKLVTGD